MIRFSPVKYEAVQLKGGLDLITPTLSLAPGVVRDGVNFECSVTGGYSRVNGYERYDGRTSPSTAVYSMATVSFSGVVSPGDTINGQTSGFTAVVIAVTSTQIAYTKTTGTFTVGENLRVGVTVFGTLTSLDGISGSGLTNAAYMALAANVYRDDISAPTGSGACRGIVYYQGNLYAFRDNSGGTSCGIWKSTSSGWTAVTLYNEISFTSGGTTAPTEGSTLTKGGVTATIKRVVLQSGTWSGGTAAGRLIITNPSGGAFSSGAATAGTTNLTLSGASTAITIQPGGRYEMVVANFGGSAGVDRIYGCDGINRSFEFDGDIYTPISTGMSSDNPKHISAHKNHLFLSFNASVQFSGLGTPYQWTILLGAGEFSAGEQVTNFIVLPGSQSGGALLVQTRNNTKILYGSSSSDWNLVAYNTGVGALHYTAQNMSGVYALDDRGVIGLNATLNYGNFDQASLTSNIRPFITSNRQYASAACVNREKSQYRVFFSNGNGLYATIVNDQYLGVLPVYFPDPVNCVWEGEDGYGNEITFFGGQSGMVYQMESGTSFDGEAINSYITLNYNAIKGPRILKRFRKASAEIQGSSYALLTFSYSLGYGNEAYAAQAQANYASSFAVGSWDSGLTWDSGLIWDGRTLLPSEIELAGTAENIAVTFSNNSDYTGPFTINSLLIHFSERRGLR